VFSIKIANFKVDAPQTCLPKNQHHTVDCNFLADIDGLTEN